MPPRGILAVVTQDLPTKGMALAGAVLLWVAVTFLGSRTVTVSDVPVAVVNLSPNLGISEELPRIAVRLRVPRAITATGDPSQLVRAFVDVDGSGLGERTVPVTVTPVSPNIDVLEVTPTSVRITLDPIVERPVPVRVVPSGTPAEGYRLGEVQADPDRVRLRAARGLFDRISGVDAEISVDQATESVEGEVAVVVPPGAQATPDRVRITVAIERSEETKTVGIRVVTKGAPAPGYWVRTVITDPTTVTVRGVRDLLDAFSIAETAPIDVGGARAPLDVQPALALPTGVSVVEGTPQIRARVDIALLEGTKDVSATVTVADVPEGYRVRSVTPSTLRVTVRGDGAAFERLADDDVQVVVSASGRGDGAFTVRPTLDDVRSPASARPIAVEEKDVTITLERS